MYEVEWRHHFFLTSTDIYVSICRYLHITTNIIETTSMYLCSIFTLQFLVESINFVSLYWGSEAENRPVSPLKAKLWGILTAWISGKKDLCRLVQAAVLSLSSCWVARVYFLKMTNQILPQARTQQRDTNVIYVNSIIKKVIVICLSIVCKVHLISKRDVIHTFEIFWRDSMRAWKLIYHFQKSEYTIIKIETI